MTEPVITTHPHPTRDQVWRVFWRGDAEATVRDVIEFEKVEESDSLSGLISVIGKWVQHVTHNPSGDALAVTITGLDELPLILIPEVCAAAPPFRPSYGPSDAA